MNTNSHTQNLGQADRVSLSRQLEEHCAAAEEFLANERLRMENIECELLEQLAALKQDCPRFVDGDANNDVREQALVERAQALDEAARQLEQARAELQTELNANAATLELVSDERDLLLETCCELEEKLTQLQASPPDPLSDNQEVQQQIADAQRRYELALEEIRSQKERIAKLEAELASPHAAAADDSEGDCPGFDWESQKKRLLAALDSGRGGESDDADRVSIENTIRKTDDIVAAKQREIDRLQRQLALLEDESAAAELRPNQQDEAAAEILDADKTIQREREKLLTLQEGMREKQRQAEVEIALERAKLARERQTLEEKLLAHESGRPVDTSDGEDQGTSEGKKSGGKWLKRLGLSEE